MLRFEAAACALAADTLDAKLAGIDALVKACAAHTTERFPSDGLAVSPAPTFDEAPDVPFKHHGKAPQRGVPVRPLRVLPQDLAPRRSLTGVAGRAALIHAVAHIEYSAIDLALDHALRFDGLPANYYADWFRVACDEARHFCLLRTHLQTLGHDYGDFPVHDGLWEMSEKTADDCLARMALVPRLLEARGLDATPLMQRKLVAVGDHEAVRILDIILHDEEDHVAIGDRWFRYLCTANGCEPETTFRSLIKKHRAPWPQGPLNIPARLAAGFRQEELDELTTGRPAD